MEVMGMNDQCGLYLVLRNLNTLHNTCGARGVRWSLNSQGFVSVFSQDLVIGLQSKPLSKDTNKILVCLQTQTHVRMCENKRAIQTYLSRKSLSTTAEMSSKGFPIPKSVFSLRGDKNYCFTQTPTHYLCMYERHWLLAVNIIRVRFDSFNFKLYAM